MTGIPLRHLLKITALSLTVGICFMVITPLVDGHYTPNIFFGGLFIGFVSMFLILLYEWLLGAPLARNLSAGASVLVNSITYLAVLSSVIVSAAFIFRFSNGEDFTLSGVLHRSDFQTGLAVSFVSILAFQLVLMINKLLGKHVLWNVLAAKYHRPREVEKIVMFLDIKSSTTIAEKIGHVPFLSLLNDFFCDLSEAVMLTGGEIYKYVGDEAILLWDPKKRRGKPDCLALFFMLAEKIEKKKAIYLRKYGYAPEFKAGIHSGTVVVGEVGSIKKEIAYLGDVLNTAARIESYCSEAGFSLIASKDAFDSLDASGRYSFTSLGCPQLRGKENKMELFGIKK